MPLWSKGLRYQTFNLDGAGSNPVGGTLRLGVDPSLADRGSHEPLLEVESKIWM